MTEETAAATTDEVRSPAGDEGSRSGSVGSGSTSAGAARRRRRRGGRGRGGRGGARSAAGTTGPSGVSPEIDLDAQPGETERVGTATLVQADIPAAEGSSAASAARRRRRGGRGRGGRGGGAQAGSPSPDRDEPDRDEPDRDEQSTAAAAATTERAPGGDTEADAGQEGVPARRRRRGGRGRKKPAGRAAAEGETAAPEEPPAESAQPVVRTRSRSRGTGRAAPAAKEDPAATRASKAPSKESRAEPKPKGRRAAKTEEPPTSTRLKRQRQSRQVRRRRDVTPAVERVTDKLMGITEHGERDQIAVLEGRDLVQHYVTRRGARSMVGNVYLGRVQNVLPGMEAAFVDVGRGRNAVLYAGEVNWSPEDLEGAPPRIEHVLKSGQSVLVQVTKDPIGGKGARLTAQVSLPGRYLVLAPDSNVTGISRRLSDAERRRLKAIYKRIKPDDHGLIVRTAAEGASEEALAKDLDRLLEEWKAIEKRAKRSKAPSILYEEPELTVRVVRDLFTDEEFRELVTDSPRVFELITDYLRGVAPDLLSKVRLHTGPLPVFEEFHIVEQIHKGLDRKVWLPSGGYVIIERTEALTVIDVNTGKAVGKSNLEETVVNTNVEAAREIARQLRLRDIGGMIVIDFIDMLLEQNKSNVIDAMKEALAQDKSRSQVFDISPLGLLEVTRKRVSGGLLDAFSETCPTCEGRGVVLTYDVN
jgi:ribonuclease E